MDRVSAFLRRPHIEVALSGFTLFLTMLAVLWSTAGAFAVMLAVFATFGLVLTLVALEASE